MLQSSLLICLQNIEKGMNIKFSVKKYIHTFRNTTTISQLFKKNGLTLMLSMHHNFLSIHLLCNGCLYLLKLQISFCPSLRHIYYLHILRFIRFVFVCLFSNFLFCIIQCDEGSQKNSTDCFIKKSIYIISPSKTSLFLS